MCGLNCEFLGRFPPVALDCELPYNMQDTQPSTSVPSKAIWRSRM